MWKPRGLHDALDPVEDDDLLQMDRGEKELLLDLGSGKVDGPLGLHRSWHLPEFTYSLHLPQGRYPAFTAFSRKSNPAVQLLQL